MGGALKSYVRGQNSEEARVRMFVRVISQRLTLQARTNDHHRVKLFITPLDDHNGAFDFFDRGTGEMDITANNHATAHNTENVVNIVLIVKHEKEILAII